MCYIMAFLQHQFEHKNLCVMAIFDYVLLGMVGGHSVYSVIGWCAVVLVCNNLMVRNCMAPYVFGVPSSPEKNSSCCHLTHLPCLMCSGHDCT